MTSDQERLTVSLTDACYMTGLGRNSVIDAIARGELRSIKLAGRRLVIVESIKEMIAARAAEPYENTKREVRNASAARRGRPPLAGSAREAV